MTAQAYIFFIFTFCFYMYIRITKTLGLGAYLWYGCLVLGVEVLGATTTLIYGAPLNTAGHPTQHSFTLHRIIYEIWGLADLVSIRSST